MAKNKKTLKRILMVLLVLVCILLAICVWQKDNITAFIESYTMSEEDMAERTFKDEQKIKEYFEENNLEQLRDLTEEEEKALINEEISEQQAIDIMKDKISLEDAKKQSSVQKEDKKPTTQNGGKKPESNKTEESNNNIDYDAKISNLVGQVYVLRSKFTSSLSGLAATVNNAFYSLPPAERNLANKNRIIAQYTQSALNMQAECDAQMNSLLKELESVLKKAGRDTSIVNSIKTRYENEKSATKSMYIREYLD